MLFDIELSAAILVTFLSSIGFSEGLGLFIKTVLPSPDNEHFSPFQILTHSPLKCCGVCVSQDSPRNVHSE